MYRLNMQGARAGSGHGSGNAYTHIAMIAVAAGGTDALHFDPGCPAHSGWWLINTLQLDSVFDVRGCGPTVAKRDRLLQCHIESHAHDQLCM